MGLQHLMELKSDFIDFEIESIKYKAKELNGDEFKEYQKEIFEMKDGKKVYHTEKTQEGLIYASLYDENENKVFQKKDRIMIGKLPQKIINLIWEYVTEANGMNETEEDTIKN